MRHEDYARTMALKNARIAELEALIPHKGNDLPEDAEELLLRSTDSPDGMPFWALAERSGSRWNFAVCGEIMPVNLSRVTHWMRVPEVLP